MEFDLLRWLAGVRYESRHEILCPTSGSRHGMVHTRSEFHTRRSMIVDQPLHWDPTQYPYLEVKNRNFYRYVAPVRMIMGLPATYQQVLAIDRGESQSAPSYQCVPTVLTAQNEFTSRMRFSSVLTSQYSTKQWCA